MCVTNQSLYLSLYNIYENNFHIISGCRNIDYIL